MLFCSHSVYIFIFYIVFLFLNVSELRAMAHKKSSERNFVFAREHASIFEAEACGILAALQLVIKYIEPPSTVCIYTDSKFVLQTFE